MKAVPPRPQMPFARPNILELAPVYEVLRSEAPVSAVITPAGDRAWLATGYRECRELLADKRLGRSHPEPDKAARVSTAAIQDGPTGSYETEEADHTRMRRLLTPSFSAKRMMSLSGHIQGLVDGFVDDLLAAHDATPDGVVDLHTGLAQPLPVSVICQLLGVPVGDGDHFRALSERMAGVNDQDDAHSAREEFSHYMSGLAEVKRAQPGEDVISDVVAAQRHDEGFSYDEMVDLCVGLLFAGHETTVNRIGLGTLFLLTRRDNWLDLVADPAGRTDACVEEIMRMSAPGDLGLVRYAHTDLDVAGVTIQRGDAVVLSVNAANRDPAVYSESERFDPDRSDQGHLGFGHGPHFCIGASLARIEMRIVFATLARRLPDLRLAADLEDLEARPTLTGGVASLPVTW
ncbi:cytochrome P450 [Streptomyces sp. NPDC046915]|uniref:cytochrome P450 n=1 Tax=Streptomyces sp. NPDC046915 TaxID=3155257 RepID=UPI0033E15982